MFVSLEGRSTTMAGQRRAERNLLAAPIRLVRAPRRIVDRAALGLVLVVAVCAWRATPLLAQNSNATIAGTVTDQTGAMVPGAQLTLTLGTSGTVRTATSGSDGNFSF